jgi:rhamnosyltransferase
MEKQHVFIVGSKGIPAEYGGFETFVDKLVQYQSTDEIQYHVARLSDRNDEFMYKGARVFNVKVPDVGPGKAVLYDLIALNACLEYCKKMDFKRAPIFYILACRIRPFIATIHKAVEELGGVLYLNPDGHEWRRSKWSWAVQKYWKTSERAMIKDCDLIICDSKNIEKYVREEYARYDPNTIYISYGADLEPSVLADDDEKFTGWLDEKGLRADEYYLVVGRFVPENNVETIIREFMSSSTTKDLAIITTENQSLYNSLEKKLHFSEDPRIKFVGTVYDQELLKKIREHAYAYLHGHQVGGTNPSLLEALASTKMNLLLNVGFNREVAGRSALYWNKIKGSLSQLIADCDAMSEQERARFGRRAKKRIRDEYSWRYITDTYEKLFLQGQE